MQEVASKGDKGSAAFVAVYCRYLSTKEPLFAAACRDYGLVEEIRRKGIPDFSLDDAPPPAHASLSPPPTDTQLNGSYF